MILEVGCCVDMYTDLCVFSDKTLKHHQPLTHALTVGGYSAKLAGLIGFIAAFDMFIDSCVRGSQIAGLNKKNSRQRAKHCSVSAIIGSVHMEKALSSLPIIQPYIYLY